MDTTKDITVHSAQQGILKTTKNFELAMAKADAAGVANCYTEDAEFMAPGGPPVVGRKNIQTAIAGYLQQGFTQYAVTSTTVYGKAGVVGVQSQYTLSQAGGKNQDIGK